MSEKSQEGKIAAQMRERLLVNRTGKMTSDQWLDIVLQPLTTLLVLMIPLSVVLLPIFLRLAFRIWVIVPLLFVMFVATILARGYRYARAPVYFATLTPGTSSTMTRFLRRAVTLYDAEGHGLHFKKWLAPRPPLKDGQPYIVYYLKDHDTNIILSLAPAHHPDAEKWQPTEMFEARLKRRTQNGKR